MTTAGFSHSEPGFTADRQSVENDIFFQTSFIGTPLLDPMGLIDSTAVDSTHTSYTGQLRAGLVMAKLDSTGAWVDYDADANDGSQIACGVLCREVFLLDPTTGSNGSRVGLVAIAGNFKAAGSNLIGLDARARNSLAKQGFNFDDATTAKVACGSTFAGTRYVTATETLTSADYGKLIVSNGSGAVVLTLPALSNGATIEVLNVADQNFSVVSAAGNDMIGVNDLSASSIVVATSSMKIGARLKFEAIYVNTTLKWAIANLSPGVVTVSLT